MRHTHPKHTLLLALTGLLLGPSSAVADPGILAELDTDFERTHDKGVFVSLEAGPTASRTQTQTQTSLGLGLDLGLKVGGTPYPDLVSGLELRAGLEAERRTLVTRGFVLLYLGPLPERHTHVGLSLGLKAAQNFENQALASFLPSGEAFVGHHIYVGPRTSLGGTLFVGGEPFTMFGSQVARTGLTVGLRLGAVFH